VTRYTRAWLACTEIYVGGMIAVLATDFRWPIVPALTLVAVCLATHGALYVARLARALDDAEVVRHD